MNTYNIEKIEQILYNIDNMNHNNYSPIIDIEFIYFLILIAVFDYKKYFQNIFKLQDQSIHFYDVD